MALRSSGRFVRCTASAGSSRSSVALVAQVCRDHQDNADKFQHNKDLTNRRIKAVEDAGAFRAPTNAARSFNPQYGDVQRLGAVDSMTVRSTEGRKTLLKLALPAPQGSSNAAGRLTRRGRPAAVRQLDDFLAPPRPRTLD